MKKYNTFVEKLFWVMIIVNPFLDAATGLFKRFAPIDSADFPLSPSLIVRLVFLLLLGIYLFTRLNKKAIFTLIPIAIAAAASVAVEVLLRVEFSLYEDLMYIARYSYNIIMIFCWFAILPRLGYKKEELLNRLNRILAWTLIIIGTNVIIGQITRTGQSTYADRFGYRGSMGYYFAGNDITAVLMLLLPIVVMAYMNVDKQDKKQRALYLISSAMAIVTNALIGTKTSFLALIATVAVVFVYSLYSVIFKKDKKYITNLAFIVVAALAVSVFTIGAERLFTSENSTFFDTITDSAGAAGEMMEKEGAGTALLSGRQVKLKEAYAQFKSSGPLAWIFGIGRGSQKGIIEMDVVEILFYYGLFGTVVMLWLYVALGIQSIIRFFKNFSFEALMILTSIALCTGYMLIAGHILFSVTAGYYYTMMFAYSEMHHGERLNDLDKRLPMPRRLS